ncbi:MAG: filamentous hemagglutinin N-terminal domain-containing protein [Planctomycetota bacterium]
MVIGRGLGGPKHRVGGRLTVVCLGALILAVAFSARGEIIRDGTTGPAGPLGGPDYTIPHTDGTVKGGNLFHSFSRFGIGAGESATFTGPAAVANVISRVTGGRESSINGQLATSGMPNADFFLINPAGIVFGANASIDVPGAFVATTADVLELADGGRFPVGPGAGPTVLTSAPPSAFGFLGADPAPLKVEGATLAVAGGQAVSLIGGDLQVEGSLRAPSGRANLVSAASAGTVDYDAATGSVEVGEGAFQEMGRVSLLADSDPSEVSVAGDPSGRILIRGGELVVEGSVMTAQTQGAADHPDVGVDVGVSGGVLLRGTTAGSAEIACSSGSGADGAAGDTEIQAGRLTLTRDSGVGWNTNLGSRSFGAGDAGSVSITVGELFVGGGCFVSAPALSTGDGGDITIHADRVEIAGDNRYAYVSSMSQGGGRAGTIDIETGEFVARGGPGGFAGVTSQTTSGSGQGGLTRLRADSVELLDGAQLDASLFSGEWAGGDVVVEAETIRISGTNPSGFPAGVFNTVSDGGAPVTQVAQGGTIRISTVDVRVVNGGRIGAWTNGQGRGGGIEIGADTLHLGDGAWVFAGSFGTGPGGDSSVDVDTLTIENRSFISCTAFGPVATSSAGDLELRARSISITGPADSTDPFGIDFTGLSTAAVTGSGGALRVTADSLYMTDRSQVSSVARGAGNAGNMQISVGQVELLNGSSFLSTTFGSGAGGDLAVTADSLLVSGVHTEPYSFFGRRTLAPSAIGSETGAGGGEAGNVILDAGRLRLRDGGLVSVSTAGAGDAGTVEVRAGDILIAGVNEVHREFLLDRGRDPKPAGAGIYSSTVDPSQGALPDPVTGDAGSVGMTARALRVADGGRISSETQTTGAGGGIFLRLGELHVSGEGQISSSSSGSGNAGTVDVRTRRGILLEEGGALATRSERSDAGNFAIGAGGEVRLVEGLIPARAAGDGGNVNVSAPDLVYLRDSEITTKAGGTGGNITIDPTSVVLDRSVLRADASLGNGGNILIVTDNFLESGSIISASSEFGVAGTIRITSPFPDVAGTLAQLPETLLSPQVRLADPCVSRFVRGASSFVVVGRDGLPIEPGAWRPSVDLDRGEEGRR